MKQINSEKIEEAVYNLCKTANTDYDSGLYETIYSKYLKSNSESQKENLANILNNIKIAFETKRPLCQDTGQVVIFLEIGQSVQIIGKNINTAINSAVEKAYCENFYRKSTVKNAIFDRTNEGKNTPAIIHTEITGSDKIELKLLIKGAGSENYSTIKMFKPTANKEEIFSFIKDSISDAGEKSCPPLVLGIGCGGTMEKAAVLSKKAFFKDKQTEQESAFIKDFLEYSKDLSQSILEIKLESEATHIACLPIAITVNCHSTRHSSCVITESGIEYNHNKIKAKDVPLKYSELTEIKAEDIESIKKLKAGQRILLTGNIYTARDAAHEQMKNRYEQDGSLPFDLKDKIFFYAGPCPPAPNEVIGPIGPTTSERMDKFCEFIHSNGIIATIGKGERTAEAKEIITKFGAKYISAQGGISCLLAKCVKKSETIAFEELGTEAIRKLYVEKLPLKVEI